MLGLCKAIHLLPHVTLPIHNNIWPQNNSQISPKQGPDYGRFVHSKEDWEVAWLRLVTPSLSLYESNLDLWVLKHLSQDGYFRGLPSSSHLLAVGCFWSISGFSYLTICLCYLRLVFTLEAPLPVCRSSTNHPISLNWCKKAFYCYNKYWPVHLHPYLLCVLCQCSSHRTHTEHAR